MSSESSLSTVGVPIRGNNCVNTGQVKAKEASQEEAGGGVGCGEPKHMGKCCVRFLFCGKMSSGFIQPSNI